MKKIGIYVQVPFCQTRCTYCNFHTGVVATSRFAPYVEAVCGEIRGHRELLRAAGIGWGSGEWPATAGRRVASRRGRNLQWTQFMLAGGRRVCWNPFICKTYWMRFGRRSGVSGTGREGAAVLRPYKKAGWRRVRRAARCLTVEMARRPPRKAAATNYL